jgi:hypothetical protein
MYQDKMQANTYNMQAGHYTYIHTLHVYFSYTYVAFLYVAYMPYMYSRTL